MNNKQQKKCTSGKFKRLNYYHGMLLDEEDLRVEQHYFREKMKLHNRLHGYGVVWGLELKAKCIEIDGKSVEKIFIEPGFALDCAGNEIVVCYPHLVPLDEKIEELCQGCKSLEKGTKLFITIEYCECKSEPQPQYTSQCAEDELHPEMSRFCEGYSIKVLEEQDVPDCCKNTHGDRCCQQPKQNCPGLAGCCEEEHVIVLGCFVLGSKEKSDEDKEDKEDPKEDLNEKYCGQERSKRNFTDKNIDPCCNPRRVCIPCLEPSSQWERQKQVLVREACLASGWIDFSGVVGKSVSDAKNYLSDIGLTAKDDTRSIQKQDPKEWMEEVENAVSCAPPRENVAIELITDSNNKCVLFALCTDRYVNGETLPGGQ